MMVIMKHYRSLQITVDKSNIKIMMNRYCTIASLYKLLLVDLDQYITFYGSLMGEKIVVDRTASPKDDCKHLRMM